MAALVLGAAGQAVGGAFGAAVGTIIGGVIDSFIIRSMTPEQRIEGRRLEDIRVTTATEGAVIPRVYGRMRVGGNIIWATDFREEVRTRTEGGGGKGGGGGGGEVRITEYFYYASFAVALCEGPISGIGRIWADGKPFDAPGAVFRIYNGTEDQPPDPWIESKQGAGNVPAYRGVAYIVFEDLPLERFGNRIPQLSFEVYRPAGESDSTEELVRAVDLIPSAGEFVFDPVQTRQIFWGGESRTVNTHTPFGKSDFVVAVDQLEETCPNCEAVSLVVSWFGTDLRAGECEVQPRAETDDAVTRPDIWRVSDTNRGVTPLVSLHDGRPAFGGTPADISVIRAIQNLKARGLRVTFYPFMLMDIPAGNTLTDPYTGAEGQPVYPWRGRITLSAAPGEPGSPDQTAAAADEVDAFFGTAQPEDFTAFNNNVFYSGPAEWSYRRMILHYAHLCAYAGGVDTFLIGSEMRGLTQIRSSASAYPAVQALRDLAADCRTILGGGTQISYAADWSEYFGHHPQDGSGDVYFHLDPLWADSNVDFVGIDNYMPLSDWREGNTHADAEAGWTSIYDVDYLQANIEGGEGFDWYYASDGNRNAQVRTPITDGAGKPWVFRYKDIRRWWLNQHYNRPGGVESGSPTAWVPQSKPIRFTEAGCPAIDKGTNQPNVFVDPKSAESQVPYFSRGVRDDFIQRRYIEALYGYWGDNGNNPASSQYSGRMVDVANLHIWTWDARPYPYFPGRFDIWTDSENWRLGHWLSGRLGASSLGALVRELCLRAGIDESLIDTSQLVATVPGYLVDGLESPRGSIEPLMRFYGFDAVESDGAIRFIPRGGQPAAELAPGDLVAARERAGEDISLKRGQETELPLALKWRLARSDEEYAGLTVEARRITVDTARVAMEHFKLAGNAPDADARCRRALFEAWLERESAAFTLPPSRMALDPSDIVLLNHDNRFMEMRINAITDGEARGIEAVRADAVLYGLRPGPERTPLLPDPVAYGEPVAALMDLPRLADEIPGHRPYAAVLAQPWYGRAAVFRSPTQDNFEFIEGLGSPARMGELAFDFYSGPVARFDLGNELWVDLYSGTLAGVPDIDLFNGANALAVESQSGVWEIVQFGEAELTQPGRYRLSRLLRGQLGTEGAMGNPAPAGSRVVLIDGAVLPLPISAAEIGAQFNWRVGPAELPPSDPAYIEIPYAPAGTGLRPYSVAHIRQPWRWARTPGDLEISWVRRTRAAAGDNWAAASAPLDEQAEAYEVDILDGGNVIRTLSSSQTSAVYTAAQQTADWGAPLAPGDQLAIVVYQVSATFGRGAPKAETLFF
ncbi:MAG: glycoside hydrolase/phage tail family protein [Methyloligellaceae bacterium]